MKVFLDTNIFLEYFEKRREYQAVSCILDAIKDSYIRMWDALYKNEDDNPTLGIILCSQRSEAIVKYSVLSEGKQLFASRYKLYLPTEEEFKRMLESIE